MDIEPSCASQGRTIPAYSTNLAYQASSIRKPFLPPIANPAPNKPITCAKYAPTPLESIKPPIKPSRPSFSPRPPKKYRLKSKGNTNITALEALRAKRAKRLL